MIILFILGLLLGTMAIVFALQNTDVVTVSFFSWNMTGSLALILTLSIVIGVIISILIILPESIKNYFRHKSLKKDNARLEEELRKQKELTVFAKTITPTEKDISQIEQGAIDSASIK